MVQLKSIKDPTDLLASFNFSQKTPKSKCSSCVSGPDLSSTCSHRVVVLGKTLNSHKASLHPGVYMSNSDLSRQRDRMQLNNIPSSD